MEAHVPVINDRGIVYTAENVRERLSVRNFMIRITSYNVCYTKLLRSGFGGSGVAPIPKDMEELPELSRRFSGRNGLITLNPKAPDTRSSIVRIRCEFLTKGAPMHRIG